MAGEAFLRALRLMNAVVLLAAAPLAGGCVDFVDVVHAGPSEPARLEVTIRLVEDTLLCGGSCRYLDGSPVPAGPGGGAAWAVATLHPGSDAGGVLRPIADTTLVVAGAVVPVVEAPAAPLGAVTYRGTLPLSTDTLDRVEITLDPSVVRGVVGVPPELSWFVPTRADPDTVAVGPEEDLVLRLRPPAAAPDPELTFASWTLEVAGESALRISASGLPPTELRVPSYYLPEPLDGVVVSRLDIFLHGAFVPPPADMITRLSVNVALRWVAVVD